MNLNFFSHGRTAFKYGLLHLGFKKGDQILLPEYICSALLDPIREMEIEPLFYEINKDFTIKYKSLNKRKLRLAKAIVTINYFGFQNSFKKLNSFFKKKKIFHIEDNSHSFFINFKKKKINSDFEFYSPKKVLEKIYNGGILKTKKKYSAQNNLKKSRLDLFTVLNKFMDIHLYDLKIKIKLLFFNQPNYLRYGSIKDKKINLDYSIDKKSKQIIAGTNLQEIRLKRQKNYYLWKKFCEKFRSVNFINRQINKNVIPWLFPVYIKDKKLRKKIFNWGWENGYQIISWPSLDKKNYNYRTREIWKYLVCFDTKRAPEKINDLKNFI